MVEIKPIKKFRPVIALAKKVDKVGNDDILQIEIQDEGDASAITSASLSVMGNDKVREDKIMEEKEIESKVEKMLSERERKDKTKASIDTIEKTSIGVESKVKEIGNKISEIDNKLLGYDKKQEETCNGVECIKNDLTNIRKETDSRFKEIADIVKQIESRTKTVVCSGAEGCNSEIPIGSTYCPNCGRHISEWPSMKNWSPFDKRKK